MNPEKALFDRAANIWREIATLHADLAELKVEFSDKVNAMSKEAITDTIAAAKLHVADQNKRAKADEKRIRREEIAERLAGASAKTAARVADERRRVEGYKERTEAAIQQRLQNPEYVARLHAFDGCDDEGNMPPHDADGVVSERPMTGFMAGLTDAQREAAFSYDGEEYVGPITAPARKPTDADLEECN